ncbi:hypothetical protein B0H63DRAFT_511581 [Podospora didyma]|uniref:Uncharacterized protein n=1 Tax=Podospora didyma TaxID=330526 RepID=A0AAE0TW89_9PEZI|nr:hypothetical protein B0H63DRAFT_511581 [Podospora didyma]
MPSTLGYERARFACPYHTLDPSQECIQPGWENCDGAAGSLSHLKGHFLFKHTETWCCGRCSQTFPTPTKRYEHGLMGCVEMPRPSIIQYMSKAREEQLKAVKNTKSGSAGGDEEMWWRWFRLLLPKIANIDGVLLMESYSPARLCCCCCGCSPAIHDQRCQTRIVRGLLNAVVTLRLKPLKRTG